MYTYMHIKIARMCFCRRLGNHMWTIKGTTIDSIVEEGGGGSWTLISSTSWWALFVKWRHKTIQLRHMFNMPISWLASEANKKNCSRYIHLYCAHSLDWSDFSLINLNFAKLRGWGSCPLCRPRFVRPCKE